MKTRLLSPATNKVAVQQFTHEGTTLALLRMRGDLRKRLLEQMARNFAAEGDYVKQGGAVSPAAMFSLLTAGTGATLSSALFANSLYVATANPATLMAIGNGVGSAVMGATGIAGQAAFVSAGAAIVPVVAPLVAFQALGTVMVLNALKAVSVKIDDLKRSLDRLIQRSEATHVGGLISADHRLRELEDDFSLCNRFTPSMAMRLALLESQVNPILERYLFLHGQAPDVRKAKADDFDYRRFDACLVVESALLDLRLDVLRLKLAAQEEISIAVKARDRLLDKIERYSELMEAIAREPREVEKAAVELKAAAESLGFWKRNLPGLLGGKRAERKAAEAQSKTLEIASRRSAIDVAPNAAEAKRAATEVADMLNAACAAPVSLVYWRDESGEHSFYTTDLAIQPTKPALKKRVSRKRAAVRSSAKRKQSPVGR